MDYLITITREDGTIETRISNIKSNGITELHIQPYNPTQQIEFVSEFERFRTEKAPLIVFGIAMLGMALIVLSAWKII